MNKRLINVRKNIKKTEKKIDELKDHLKTLRLKEKNLENEDILKVIREMAGKGNDPIEYLGKISTKAIKEEIVDEH